MNGTVHHAIIMTSPWWSDERGFQSVDLVGEPSMITTDIQRLYILLEVKELTGTLLIINFCDKNFFFPLERAK